MRANRQLTMTIPIAGLNRAACLLATLGDVFTQVRRRVEQLVAETGCTGE